MFDRRAWVFCFLAVMLYSVEIHCGPVPVSGQAIQLTISHDQVRSHAVSCTLDARLTSMERATGLTLYGSKAYGKAGEFDSLASIDLWDPQAKLLNDLGDADVEAFGLIGTGDEPRSNIGIFWKSPVNGWPRQFKCEADGLDRTGAVVTISMTTNTATPGDRAVHLGNQHNQGLIGEHQDNRSSADVETMDTACQNLTSTVDAIQKSVESLEELMKDQTSLIKETIRSELKDLKLASLARSYDISGVLHGRRYFVTKVSAPFNLQAADRTCEVLGGHLLEIEDKEEYDFVFDFCKGLGGDHFFTGGNDIQDEGAWTYWRSGKPVTVTNWGPGQPDNSNNEDCLTLYMGSGASNDNQCDATGKFVCETPA